MLYEVITDEEGPAINGTRKVMEHLKAQNDLPEVRILGEPTCREYFGEMMKIGRRGSLTAYLTVNGVQGHVAYPESTDNPVITSYSIHYTKLYDSSSRMRTRRCTGLSVLSG